LASFPQLRRGPDAGLFKLKPERSTNFSAGFVLHPLPKLQITVDAYQIKIRDRIVASGNVFGSVGTTVISQAVLDALHSRGVSTADATSYSGINIFTNGVDTRTRGIEATATYASDFANVGHFDWSLGFNYNKTDITKINALPSQVYDGSTNTALLTQYAKDGLTTATPRVKVIGNILWTHSKWSINLRETIYGETSQHESPDGTGSGADAQLVKIGTTGITDLNIGYKLTRGLRLDVGQTICSTSRHRPCPSSPRPAARSGHWTAAMSTARRSASRHGVSTADTGTPRPR
jgi:iron complex outermembrane receptor protein